MVQEKGRAMIGAIIPFLITPLGRWAAIGAMILAAWIGFASHYRKQGAERVEARIEKATNDAVKKAARAGNKSSDPQSRGVLNPNYRD